MDLKVLGCHGGETRKHRTSSFLLDDRLAVDAGAITSMLSLEEQRGITSAIVSHAHMDHVRDLATLADNRCQQGGPTLEICGIPETLAALQNHFFNDRIWPDFTRIKTAMGPTIVYRELEPEVEAEVAGLRVKPVLVSHTIDTAGFVITGSSGSIAYSGDTGPTERFWEVLNAQPDLRAVLMEVSFPDDQLALATVSGHHTPFTLKNELRKLKTADPVPFLLYHIKPVFQAQVEKELARISDREIQILQLGEQFLF